MTSRHARDRLVLLAGWIFADLFLVLLLVGLAELPSATSATPTASPTPQASTAPPTKEPERGLEEKPVDFDIEVRPADFRTSRGSRRELVAKVRAKLAALGHADRVPGFVLVFASGSEPGQATRTASAAYRLLHRAGGPFEHASGVGYWSGKGDHFEFKVFFLK